MEIFLKNRCCVGGESNEDPHSERFNRTKCDTAQGKDAPKGNFLMLYAENLGRYNRI